jgi:uncharacterized protein YwqG
MRVVVTRIETYLPFDDPRIERLELKETQLEDYDTLAKSVYDDQPKHQLFGHIVHVQYSDMCVVAQLAHHGMSHIDCLTPEQIAEADTILAELEEWVLLFQYDSDDGSGIMFGDAGIVYFWIKADDLAAGNFTDVWAITQCY